MITVLLDTRVLIGLLLVCCIISASQAEAPIIDPLDVQDRVLRLEQRLAGRKELDLLTKITQLESRERELQGQLEQRAHEIEQLKKSQQAMYMDLEKRIQALEQKINSTSVSITPSLSR